MIPIPACPVSSSARRTAWTLPLIIAAGPTMSASDGAMAIPDLISNLGQLLIAGHETTVNLIANGTLALLRHPDVLGRLRGDPSIATLLVEEVLRYDPPVRMVGRSALTDVTVSGAAIPAGSRIRLLLAAGDCDPRRFADPRQFHPERADNAHITFGGGLHYCVGAALARHRSAGGAHHARPAAGASAPGLGPASLPGQRDPSRP